ncbi:MAG: hypothetical protein M3N19_11635 [Candidatus Eremiobacteraeota bacterium]|nr:hypothetical protein [Candidatus Eremiobacteraeota bacterium]
MILKKLLARLRGGNPQNENVPHAKLNSAAFNFIGPKEGPIENELKADWASAFGAEPIVERAYLALASHFITDGAPVVVLCIKFSDNMVHEKIVFEAMSLFRQKGFDTSQMLDVLPISVSQEEALAAVCAPFYVSRFVTHRMQPIPNA